MIDNMAILFVIGVGVGMSEKNDGTGGIAALASWLMMTTLLSTGFVTTIMPSIADSATKTLAFDKIANPFIGILSRCDRFFAVTTNLRIQSFRTGCHSSAASVA